MNTQARVLIVDDEEVVRDTLDMLLGDQYQLSFAENGVEGLALALQVQPDAILLDAMMPRMNGFDVCRQIRANPLLAEIPVIMITALDDRESRLHGLRAGVDDFLTKPLDTLELSARLQTITRLNRYRHLVEQRSQLKQAHQMLLISYTQTIEGWVNALDLRDKETEGHSQRVTQLTVEFARKVGVPEDQLDDLRMGALLHDIGKLGVPDSILLKPGKLTADEWVIMRKHPEHAYKWLASIEYLRSAIDIPYAHHEKWDGTGYPRGLKGEEIPLAARIFAIVDVWDALRSDRPYRESWSAEKVIEYIKTQVGTHFDPAIAAVFFDLIAENNAHIT
ncbi:MAG: response regulator [Chloroflexi bacterium]|nr:response regulator [Chloroflexota bacterium]